MNPKADNHYGSNFYGTHGTESGLSVQMKLLMFLRYFIYDAHQRQYQKPKELSLKERFWWEWSVWKRVFSSETMVKYITFFLFERDHCHQKRRVIDKNHVHVADECHILYQLFTRTMIVSLCEHKMHNGDFSPGQKIGSFRVGFSYCRVCLVCIYYMKL